MLLQLSKEHLIHGGLSKDDVFFQFTTRASRTLAPLSRSR
jgi:hypothetical protein